MTYDNVKLSFAVTHRAVIYTIMIILILTFIVGTLMIGEWMATTLYGHALQMVKKYEIFLN